MRQEEKYSREMMDENYSRDVAGCCRVTIIAFCVVAIIVGIVLSSLM